MTAPDPKVVVEAARAALARREWRAAVAGLAELPALALDPTAAGLKEEELGAAFALLSHVMMKMRTASADDRANTFASICAKLGIDPPDEGRGVWLGLLAWAEAHPPRAKLLAGLQQAYLDAGRSWSQLCAPKLRPALMARALFYAKQPAWRESARKAVGGLAGDPRGHALREDLFLWFGGLVEWARQPIDLPGHLTTGEVRASLLASLAPADEACFDGLLTAAGHPGADPWDARLVRVAGLLVLSADEVLELVRLRRSLPDPEEAYPLWAQEVGTAGELERRPWARVALEAEVGRLERLLEEHGTALRDAASHDQFEVKLTSSFQPFRLADHFAASDIPFAWASLRDFVRLREVPAPAMTAEEAEALASGSGQWDPDPNVIEQATSATWRYGRRLLGRDARLGYNVLGPLVQANWDELGAKFIDLVTRHPPREAEDLERIADVLTAQNRGPAVIESLLVPLARQRHPGRWPVLLEAVLEKLPHEDLVRLLPRVGAVVIERRGELHTLLGGLVRLYDLAGQPTAALDLCLGFLGAEGRGGEEALALAAQAARAIPDWDAGGRRVLEAAREQGELVPEVWEDLLELATRAGRTPDALALLLSWASRSATPSGHEKPREKLALEWSWALEVAARIPGWDEGFLQVWTAAADATCPVPAVWRALVRQATERQMPVIVHEGSKRFVEAWGADAEITQGLWEQLERAVHAPSPESAEIVDLLHWLHVDLGHNRWQSEEDFARRVVALPGVSARMLGDWAMRKLYSTRRWSLLGTALAGDPAGLDELLAVVCEVGHPTSRALEGLAQGLPEERSWGLLARTLPGPAASLDWAWMEVLKRWRLAPGERAPQLFELLEHMPPPPGPVTPAFEQECKLLSGYLLAGTPADRWPGIATTFQRIAPGGALWNFLLSGLARGPRGPVLYEAMIAELVDPLEHSHSVHGHARMLRERLIALANGRPEPEPVYVEGG